MGCFATISTTQAAIERLGEISERISYLHSRDSWASAEMEALLLEVKMLQHYAPRDAANVLHDAGLGWASVLERHKIHLVRTRHADTESLEFRSSSLTAYAAAAKAN